MEENKENKDNKDCKETKENKEKEKEVKRKNSISYPFGALILEIIDEGVGMMAEEYNLLFKDIVQFNPNELQVI